MRAGLARQRERWLRLLPTDLTLTDAVPAVDGFHSSSLGVWGGVTGHATHDVLKPVKRHSSSRRRHEPRKRWEVMPEGVSWSHGNTFKTASESVLRAILLAHGDVTETYKALSMRASKSSPSSPAASPVLAPSRSAMISLSVFDPPFGNLNSIV